MRQRARSLYFFPFQKALLLSIKFFSSASVTHFPFRFVEFDPNFPRLRSLHRPEFLLAVYTELWLSSGYRALLVFGRSFYSATRRRKSLFFCILSRSSTHHRTGDLLVFYYSFMWGNFILVAIKHKWFHLMCSIGSSSSLVF